MPLPILEFPIADGLYTKARQEDVSALVTATNVDYFDRAGGVGHVPGTLRRSDTASGTWQSIHHHDGYLSGTLTRMQVGLVGSLLRKIATDNSLLTLRTGMTSEPLFGVSSQDRLHLASASNTPIKVTLGDVVSLWGIAAPTSAPTAVKGSTGNVNAGSHSYAVTYVTTYGKESNRSTASNEVVSTGSRVTVTIPTSPEVQVVSRKLYRDDQGDQIFRFLATISDNSTTTYEDNLTNADLSSVTAPEASSPIDNSPPVSMAFVAPFESYIFGVEASDRSTLVWTEANEPEYWPILNSRTFQSEITALSPILGGLVVCGSDWMVAVTGGEGGSRTLSFNEVNPELGCVGPRAICRVKQALFLIHDDGPHLTTLGEDDWYLATQIRDQIDALDHSTFASSFLVYERNRYRVLWHVDGEVFCYSFGNQGTGEVSPEGQGVDPLDLRRGKWSRISYPSSQTTTCAAIVETAADTPEVWLGTSSGVIYKIDASTKTYAVGSIPNAITATVETTFEKAFQGDADIEGMARYLTIKGYGEAASTWTATLTSAADAGGPELRAVSRSVVIGPGTTSKKYSVPRGYQGPYWKIKLVSNTQGELGVIEKAQLHMIPRPARGERA